MRGFFSTEQAFRQKRITLVVKPCKADRSIQPDDSLRLWREFEIKFYGLFLFDTFIHGYI